MHYIFRRIVMYIILLCTNVYFNYASDIYALTLFFPFDELPSYYPEPNHQPVEWDEARHNGFIAVDNEGIYIGKTFSIFAKLRHDFTIDYIKNFELREKSFRIFPPTIDVESSDGNHYFLIYGSPTFIIKMDLAKGLLIEKSKIDFTTYADYDYIDYQKCTIDEQGNVYIYMPPREKSLHKFRTGSYTEVFDVDVNHVTPLPILSLFMWDNNLCILSAKDTEGAITLLNEYGLPARELKISEELLELFFEDTLGSKRYAIKRILYDSNNDLLLFVRNDIIIITEKYDETIEIVDFIGEVKPKPATRAKYEDQLTRHKNTGEFTFCLRSGRTYIGGIYDATVDEMGNIYVLSYGGYRIYRLKSDGEWISENNGTN